MRSAGKPRDGLVDGVDVGSATDRKKPSSGSSWKKRARLHGQAGQSKLAARIHRPTKSSAYSLRISRAEPLT